MSNIFAKPPLSISEQIVLLESRGLKIPDKAKAQHYLSFISYYRLSGYAISFERIIGGKRNHQFELNTSFDDILELYNFDRLLRLLMMDAIERIEVAVRTQICLQMALIHQDSHWHMNRILFKPSFNFKKFLEECNNEFSKSREIFIRHYKNNYHSPGLPPSWMMIELLSIGTWSILYLNLANRYDKKQISDAFDLSPIELQSWLHCITYLRNLCAHHARLWNRHFTITPTPKPKYQAHLTPNYMCAAQAAMLHILLKVISPCSGWTNRLLKLFQEHPAIDPGKMGFPKRWEENYFWDITPPISHFIKETSYGLHD